MPYQDLEIDQTRFDFIPSRSISLFYSEIAVGPILFPSSTAFFASILTN